MAYVERSARSLPVAETGQLDFINYELIPLLQEIVGQLNVLSGDVQSISADYEVLSTDNVILVADGATIGLTLPPAIDFDDVFLTVKKKGDSAHNVTLTASGSETIDGSATEVLGQNYGWVTIFCDGVAWHVVQRGSAS